jgi:hypothetical protein
VAVSMPMPNSRTGNNRHNAHKLPDMSSMGKTLLTDHEARTAMPVASGLHKVIATCMACDHPAGSTYCRAEKHAITVC